MFRYIRGVGKFDDSTGKMEGINQISSAITICCHIKWLKNDFKIWFNRQ